MENTSEGLPSMRLAEGSEDWEKRREDWAKKIERFRKLLVENEGKYEAQANEMLSELIDRVKAGDELLTITDRGGGWRNSGELYESQGWGSLEQIGIIEGLPVYLEVSLGLQTNSQKAKKEDLVLDGKVYVCGQNGYVGAAYGFTLIFLNKEEVEALFTDEQKSVLVNQFYKLHPGYTENGTETPKDRESQSE